MNAKDKHAIADIILKASGLYMRLKDLQEGHQERLDNMPENLQASERYEKMSEVQDNIDSAVDNLSDSLDYLNEIIDNEL